MIGGGSNRLSSFGAGLRDKSSTEMGAALLTRSRLVSQDEFTNFGKNDDVEIDDTLIITDALKNDGGNERKKSDIFGSMNRQRRLTDLETTPQVVVDYPIPQSPDLRPVPSQSDDTTNLIQKQVCFNRPNINNNTTQSVLGRNAYISDSQISTVDSFTNKHICYRLGMALAIIVLVAAGAAVQFFLGKDTEYPLYLVWFLVYIPAANILLF